MFFRVHLEPVESLPILGFVDLTRSEALGQDRGGTAGGHPLASACEGDGCEADGDGAGDEDHEHEATPSWQVPEMSTTTRRSVPAPGAQHPRCEPLGRAAPGHPEYDEHPRIKAGDTSAHHPVPRHDVGGTQCGT